MPIYHNNDLPMISVPRIKTRVLVGDGSGATMTALWEQWMSPEGHIPLHYHDVEEVLVILSGDVSLTLESETSAVPAPATVLIPRKKMHALRPAGTNDVHLLAFFPVASPKIFSPDGATRPMPWEDTGRSGSSPTT